MKRATRSDSVALLDRDMAGKNLSGYWRLGMEGLPPQPMTAVEPCLWKWADVHESLARAHRHTPAALRFVIEGNGAYTTVNGQQCVMEPGDLILTPKLTWHDHSNDSNQPMLWLDGLDFPLVTALHQVMQERYSERRQPIEKSSEEVMDLLGASKRHGVPLADFFHYKWRDTQKTLRALARSPAARDRFDGYLLEYRNPLTGGPTMTTIQCALQLLPPGDETETHRHTSTVIYHVFRGKARLKSVSAASSGNKATRSSCRSGTTTGI